MIASVVWGKVSHAGRIERLIVGLKPLHAFLQINLFLSA